jgi:hypothetical protein
MANLSIEDIQKQREYFKENYGIDILTNIGQSIVLNQGYKRDKGKFINDLVKIEDRDVPGVVVSFKLWDAQREVLKLFESEHRIISLKARQLGLTWLALAYATHGLIYQSGYSANIVCQTEDNSKEMVRRTDFILRHLPNWLIVNKDASPEEKKENITGLMFEFQTTKIVITRQKGEPSVFKGFTSSASSGHGFTANLIILDEWARHPDADKIWEAAFPTINRPSGGQVIGISTGLQGTFFKEMWDGSNWEYGGEKGAGRNTFVGIFLPWDSDPRRDRDWYEQTKKNIPQSYKSQYPSTPSEAFSAGKGAMFEEWDPRIHVPYDKSWYPPGSWRIVLAYDGAYKRAAAIWFAISPDGWAVAYREYYPYHKIDPEQAEDINSLSRDADGAPEVIDYFIADTSCWAKNQGTGETTIEIMENHGLYGWRQADKDRIMGWRRVHEWLTPIRDEEDNLIPDRYGDPLAKLRFTENCGNFIRIMPGLKFNPNKPEDLEGGQEDHLIDCVRYFLMSRPKAGLTKQQKEEMEEKRRKLIKPRSNVTGY